MEGYNDVFAWNEVTLMRSSTQAAKLRVIVNGVTRIRDMSCDGLICATPMGSTAYNKAAGGKKRLFTMEESTGKIVQTGITFDHHFDAQQAISGSRFKVQMFPAVFVIDGQGTIVLYHGGQIWEQRAKPDAFTVGDLRIGIEKALLANPGN